MPMRSNSTTFTNNMKLPIHRWFRFSAGYSAGWVDEAIRAEQSASECAPLAVLDPFSGSCTTLLAASGLGCESWGWEAQDLVFRIGEAKLSATKVQPASLLEGATQVLDMAPSIRQRRSFEDEPKLLRSCYSEESLAGLRTIQDALARLRPSMDEHIHRLLWLNLVSILRPVSHAGTAQWQYVLPNKSKAKTVGALDGFRLKAGVMAEDIAAMKPHLIGEMHLQRHDAREPSGVANDSIDLVVTSPPYANNYDYADATRLEMTFLDEVQGWSDLKRVREPLIHACSQHMTGYDSDEAIDNVLLLPIVDRLRPIYEDLSEVRLTKGGKKAYHSMVVAYFLDMASVWNHLRAAVKPGGRALFVVGDSAPYGVHVPVETFHGELAVAAGFKSFSFEKTRDRNIKWKNRKHRVPLKEGTLEVLG